MFAPFTVKAVPHDALHPHLFNNDTIYRVLNLIENDILKRATHNTHMEHGMYNYVQKAGGVSVGESKQPIAER